LAITKRLQQLLQNVAGQVLLRGLGVQRQHPKLVRFVLNEIDDSQPASLAHAGPNLPKLTNTARPAHEITGLWILHHVLLQLGIFIVVQVDGT
jgi:hypothetical protein